MKQISVFSVALTLISTIVAAVVLWKVIDYYMFSPWTRDGRVRADIVQIAPDISGWITDIRVIDNQPVRKGQVLFVIDEARYQLAYREAVATLAQRRATYDEARREDVRNGQLGNLVAVEVAQQSHARAQEARAQMDLAKVAVDTAQLNLHRTAIVSPVDGYVNDRAPRLNEYATAGKAVLSIVDAHSFRVDGYFEETKMRHIRVGQQVDIVVMGEPRLLRGHVVSIVAGIEDRDRTVSPSNLLPNVDPAFSWVRLAQRIPVRVALDEVPSDFQMIAGRTATVLIRGPELLPLGMQGASAADAASAPQTRFGLWLERVFGALR
ncbi:efflux RND transporter periplasmic adaptor subunit [Paraburkholderia rhizosphaerae]|uniref:RND family efflux transporter MFP subunit n=1 Tax=Paraburkholderia rhizosphaerae TaxID=480658 RepID=A0A4R8LSB2_9BURK|nr:efflux RND transporter periplasmic adaptor subunit [Paraburkholderia rhizosphaerae]TDY50424.1 RND family efflux transporter MFP subunit [Paraburkholderia rhizosphaerae]